MERYFELCEETPFSDEVQKQYNPSNERIQHANYKMDLEIAKLKRSLWITHFRRRFIHFEIIMLNKPSKLGLCNKALPQLKSHIKLLNQFLGLDQQIAKHVLPLKQLNLIVW